MAEKIGHLFKRKKVPEFVTEAWVKKEVKRILDHFRIWWFMPAAGGWGNNGVPDFVCCYNGFFIGIEAKKGTGVWSKQQQNKANGIVNKGYGWYILVDEDGLEKLVELLDDLETEDLFDFRGKTLRKGR